jgi:uncharacterized protein YneF (UPF0154 family)
VSFDSGYVKNVDSTSFTRKQIKSPYCKSLCGIGYSGEGEFMMVVNGVKTREYKIWNSIMRRCYDNTLPKKTKIYDNVYVCDEWHNFQNFAKWYRENYYEIKNEKMCLDKDILIKGNKIYSPETCCIVPAFINSLFLAENPNISKKHLKGVSKMIGNKYSSSIKMKNKFHHIGCFEREIDAHLAYIKTKCEYAKSVAEKYSHIIPKIVYDKLINYSEYLF